MKKNLRNNWRIYFVLLLLTLSSCGKDHDHAEEDGTYTCPMHPTVVSDRPGTCPVCGMDLVRKARPGEVVEITEDLAKLLRSPNETVLSSIKTIKGQYKSLPVTVTAHGVVTYDTRNIYTIPARVSGRLEKIFLTYEFQHVSKGQKIAEIYSPELITAQRELVFLLEYDPENKSLIDAAAKKLELLGMTSRQVNELSQKKEADNTISVYSPYSGYLITGQQAPWAPVTMPSTQSAGGAMRDGMEASPSTTSRGTQQPQGNTSATGSIVREGDYVTAGQTLFTVVNANALRIELNLPGNYIGIVKEGDKVEVDLGNDQREAATVDFIQPFFGEGQEFLKLRVYTNKTEGLQIGQLVNARINVESKESLWVPKEAVLDLGVQKVVFHKDGGVLKPMQVTTGITAAGMIEIKSGLASSEEIASNAQYLVDSESFIKTVN